MTNDNKDCTIAKPDMQQQLQLQPQILRVAHAINIIADAGRWEFLHVHVYSSQELT